MMKCRKSGSILSFSLGIISLSLWGLESNAALAAVSAPVLKCETSLKKFSARLEKLKIRNRQVYYRGLYQQIQDFLEKLRELPSSHAASSQLESCENLLKAAQDIVGSYDADAPAPLPSMAPCATPSIGKLNPRLEAAARPLQIGSIRYVDKAVASQEREEDLEEWDFDEPPFASGSSAPHSAGARKHPLAPEREPD